MTIYLPEDLAEEVRAEDGINISATCQDALREELRRRKAMAVAMTMNEGEFERVEVWVAAEMRYKAFGGRLIATDPDFGQVYLTPKGLIAVYSPKNQDLEIFNDYDELDGTYEGPEFQANVARALGVKVIDELDL